MMMMMWLVRSLRLGGGGRRGGDQEVENFSGEGRCMIWLGTFSVIGNGVAIEIHSSFEGIVVFNHLYSQIYFFESI